MKPINLQILIIILSFYFIMNEEIEIKNFVKYYLNDESLKFVYHFHPNISEKNDCTPYFFFGV